MRVPFAIVTLLCVLLSIASTSCGEQSAAPLAFQPVVARAIQTLEVRISRSDVATPSLADLEQVATIRSSAASLASVSGPMRPLMALSARDYGPEAVPVLAQMLAEASLSADVRVAVAEMLAAIDTPAAAEVLVYHASDNPVSWVRAQCAFRLASTTQDQVVPRLIAAHAREENVEARTFLASTLAHFGCTTFRVAGADVASVAPPSERSKLEVWRLLGDPAEESEEARIAVLAQLPDFAADICAEALLDEHPEVRLVAARSLAGMGLRAADAGPSLLESLVRDPTVATAAITALAAVHHTPAVPEIERRLADRARSVTERTAAARALGLLDSARSVSLLEAARDEGLSPELRAACIESLVRLGVR